jgi:hypothetical protein
MYLPAFKAEEKQQQTKKEKALDIQLSFWGDSDFPE